MTLDIGCGKRKVEPDALGIDMSADSAADTVWNLDEFPWPLEDDRFDRIHMSHIIEHLQPEAAEAMIAELVRPDGHVYSIERIQVLADRAKSNLDTAGYSDMVTTIVADGSMGYPMYAPYDRISVACGAPDFPPPLFEQLKEGGKMLIPVGGRTYQELYLVTKVEGKMKKEDLGSVLFVPLIGEHGFKE